MTKTNVNHRIESSIKTIQLWPSGQSVTYRIDYIVPRNQTYPEEVYKIKKDNRWERATKEEYRQIRIEELAEMYAERDILCCDSCLVDDLARMSFESNCDVAQEFSIEEWKNVYVDTSDWTAKQCREYCDDNGIEYPSRSNPFSMGKDEVIEELYYFSDFHHVMDKKKTKNKDVNDLREQLFSEIDKEIWGNVGDWRDAVEESVVAAEPYEWWRVTEWLCRELSDIGEVVIDNSYGYWWGRCTTGQALIMDGVLQKIAAKFV